MLKALIAVAVIAVGGLALGAGQTATAQPAGLGALGPALESQTGFVRKVHGWHCRRRLGWNWGVYKRHNHSQACGQQGCRR